MNKKKIINDPVLGFITINSDLILKLIDHPYLQRLRRIKQLGLTEFVYPSAVHTRFHHALGAMHLMELALNSLRSKGIKITDDEYEAALTAILLHDIGHGPLSHTLEYSLTERVEHEMITVLIMQKLDQEFGGRLKLPIRIFKGDYERNFFHQLVAGHFDIDRMDYLKRDSFYTGVSEGNVGVIRIINMLNVVDNELVVDEKGIYNIENFLIARRFMYWQVYLHKTTVAAEKMMENLFARARFLLKSNSALVVPPALKPFLVKRISANDFQKDNLVLENFLNLDDSDIWEALKNWKSSSDKILSDLSNWILNRRLFTIEMSGAPFDAALIDNAQKKISEVFEIDNPATQYYFSHGLLFNSAYGGHYGPIKVLTKKGLILLEDLSEVPAISELSKIVRKYYLCYPKNVSL